MIARKKKKGAYFTGFPIKKWSLLFCSSMWIGLIMGFDVWDAAEVRSYGFLA